MREPVVWARSLDTVVGPLGLWREKVDVVNLKDFVRLGSTVLKWITDTRWVRSTGPQAGPGTARLVLHSFDLCLEKFYRTTRHGVVVWEDGIHVVFICVTPVTVCSITRAVSVVMIWGVEEVQTVEPR